MAAFGVVQCRMASVTRARSSQVTPAFKSSFLKGQALCLKASVRPARVAKLSAQASAAVLEAETEERLRLNNLGPQPGARRKNKRKGRGYGGHQGGTCGFGMRGQKSRAGSGVRPGFEGGQTPLYRRLPKLKGIAGGMKAGVPSYLTVNLDDLNEKFDAGEEVSLETLQAKNLLNVSGRDKKLPLKILGTGDLAKPLTIHAAAFSGSAKEKISAGGGTAVTVPQKPTWTRALHKKLVAARAEAEAAAAETRKAERAAAKAAKKAGGESSA